MIQRMVDAENMQNVIVTHFDGLMVNYAHAIGADYVIRGCVRRWISSTSFRSTRSIFTSRGRGHRLLHGEAGAFVSELQRRAGDRFHGR
jgi:hypothetical protein